MQVPNDQESCLYPTHACYPQEYEKGASPEAVVVKDLDKFDMMFQAFEYEKGVCTRCIILHSFDLVSRTPLLYVGHSVLIIVHSRVGGKAHDDIIMISSLDLHNITFPTSRYIITHKVRVQSGCKDYCPSLRLGGMHTRHFGRSVDRGLPFLSPSMPKSFQTAVTASLINDISALPAAGSPGSVQSSRVGRSLLLLFDRLSCFVYLIISIFNNIVHFPKNVPPCKRSVDNGKYRHVVHR